MLHRHLAKLAIFGLFLAACSGAPTDNTGSSNSALRGGNGNGQGDDCQGDDGQGDDCQGDDGQGDDQGHCVQRAHVQLITMDSTDLITGTNLVTFQTQQYQLVFGSTRLNAANLGSFPQNPIKTAAQDYNTALASGNQSSITVSIQDYANLGGRADVTFRTNVFGQRTLTSFTPVAN